MTWSKSILLTAVIERDLDWPQYIFLYSPGIICRFVIFYNGCRGILFFFHTFLNNSYQVFRKKNSVGGIEEFDLYFKSSVVFILSKRAINNMEGKHININPKLNMLNSQSIFPWKRGGWAKMQIETGLTCEACRAVL